MGSSTVLLSWVQRFSSVGSSTFRVLSSAPPQFLGQLSPAAQCLYSNVHMRCRLAQHCIRCKMYQGAKPFKVQRYSRYRHAPPLIASRTLWFSFVQHYSSRWTITKYKTPALPRHSSWALEICGISCPSFTRRPCPCARTTTIPHLHGSGRLK